MLHTSETWTGTGLTNSDFVTHLIAGTIFNLLDGGNFQVFFFFLKMGENEILDILVLSIIPDVTTLL